jgi:hypothetical protein
VKSQNSPSGKSVEPPGTLGGVFVGNRFGRCLFSVWQFHRDVPRRAYHALTTVGIATASEGFQQKKKFLGEHLRIPPLVIWMLV